MHIGKSLLLCFAMFSRVPIPRTDWSKKNMRYLMAFFPLVGLFVGAVTFAWGYLCSLFAFSPLLRGVGFTCLPVLLTGGIHLDGFCDTVDALASHADCKRKQEILKDPHIGAFAGIFVGIYLLAYTAFAAEADLTASFLCAYLLLHVLARCLSGVAVVFFPCAKSSGLAHTFADAAARRVNGIVLSIWGGISAVLLVLLCGIGGAAAVVISLAVFLLYRHTASRQFGGISGDLAGWFLQLCELGGLAALALLPLQWTGG